MCINKLPKHTSRVETGPIQFGEDWPGLFIRGDTCIELKLILLHALESNLSSIYKMQAQSYIDLIEEVHKI